MTFLTRKRAIAAAMVAAFLAAFAIIGAVSRSSPTAAQATPGGAALPTESWYWTMAASSTNPFDLVLATDAGLFRSTDAGKTWAATGPKGLDATALAVSGSTIFAGGVSAKQSLSPLIHKGVGRTAPDGPGVLTSSADDGASWTVLHPTGLPKTSIQALAANATSLYVVLNTGQIYRSSDAAKSFSLLAGKTEKSPWAIALLGSGGFLAGDMDNGAFTSATAKSWAPTAFTDQRGGKMVMEYAVQPGSSSKILMTSIGIEQSTDGGKSWHPSLKSSVMFGPVTWSSATVAYAVGFDGSLWRTDNAGTSWKKVG